VTTRGGFTLVEVLVALAIISFVLLTAHMVLWSTLTASERVRAVSEPTASVEALLWLLREDLRGVPAAGLTEKAFAGSPSEQPGTPLVSFLTVSDPMGQRTGTGLWEVSYQVRPSARQPGSFDLLRAEVPWHRGPLAEVVYAPLFRGLSSFDLQYSDGAEWHATWSEELGGPVAVRIRLRLTVPEQAQAESYQLDVWLPVGGASVGAGGTP
jgi:prepilin-type N-terminal cleavage/methylation domain-containing protein